MKTRERLNVFLKTFPSGECIDDLHLSFKQRSEKIADYFFDAREIVCELKTLNADPFYKIEERLRVLAKREEWPWIFGAKGLDRLLEVFPDAKKIRRTIYSNITNLVEESIKDANRQIRSTKKSFNLPDSDGLLIFLNDRVHILSPPLITSRILNALKKLDSVGQPRFPYVDAVLFINTAHLIQEELNTFSFPMYKICNPNCRSQRIVDFVDYLATEWCKAEGIMPVQTDWRNMEVVYREAIEIGEE